MIKKENIKDGLVEKFYDNGQLLLRENYKNGKLNGLWEYFDESGKSRGNENYKAGKLVE